MSGSAADVEELSGSELAPGSSSRGLLLCDSSADGSSFGSLPFRRSRCGSCGKMSTVDHLRIDLSAIDLSARHSSKLPDVVRSLRAVFCRRKSPGVNACASFSPWGVDGVGFKSEYRSKAEPTEKNDEPPCEAEPTENKGCIEEEVHVPYGFALVGTGLPPPLNPWTPNYVSMVPADLAGSAVAGPAQSAATASMSAMTERRARNLMSEIAI